MRDEDAGFGEGDIELGLDSDVLIIILTLVGVALARPFPSLRLLVLQSLLHFEPVLAFTLSTSPVFICILFSSLISRRSCGDSPRHCSCY